MLLLFGDFNTDLAVPESWERDEGGAAALAEEGLEDMSGHFLPRNKWCLKDGCTWAMHQGGRKLRSCNNYILGTDSCLFQNVAVWDARHNTDHYLVLGCLLGAAPAARLRSLGNLTRFSIRPMANLDKAYRMFSGLWRSIPRPT